MKAVFYVVFVFFVLSNQSINCTSVYFFFCVYVMPILFHPIVLCTFHHKKYLNILKLIQREQ